MNAGIFVLLFVIAVILLGIYAIRPKAVLIPTRSHQDGQGVAMMHGPQPQMGESGFGIGAGSGGVDLTEKPPMTACSTLNRKPRSAEVPTSELTQFFQPAGLVPTEYNPGTIGSCPPIKPMSSSTPLADVPMCVFKGDMQ